MITARWGRQGPHCRFNVIFKNIANGWPQNTVCNWPVIGSDSHKSSFVLEKTFLSNLSIFCPNPILSHEIEHQCLKHFTKLSRSTCCWYVKLMHAVVGSRFPSSSWCHFVEPGSLSFELADQTSLICSLAFSVFPNIFWSRSDDKKIFFIYFCYCYRKINHRDDWMCGHSTSPFSSPVIFFFNYSVKVTLTCRSSEHCPLGALPPLHFQKQMPAWYRNVCPCIRL